MNTPTACLPTPIQLGPRPLRRLQDAIAALSQALREQARRAAHRRAERRLARAQHALVTSLDARTLRDIGLGDFAGAAHDDDASIWLRNAPLRNP